MYHPGEQRRAEPSQRMVHFHFRASACANLLGENQPSLNHRSKLYAMSPVAYWLSHFAVGYFQAFGRRRLTASYHVLPGVSLSGNNCLLILPLWNVASNRALGIGRPGRRPMKIAFFAFLVFLGGVTFLLSFVADREMKAGDDRVARKMSRSVIDPKSVSERSPLIRTNASSHRMMGEH
jgi:hypothetical protein